MKTLLIVGAAVAGAASVVLVTLKLHKELVDRHSLEEKRCD